MSIDNRLLKSRIAEMTARLDVHRLQVEVLTIKIEELTQELRHGKKEEGTKVLEATELTADEQDALLEKVVGLLKGVGQQDALYIVAGAKEYIEENSIVGEVIP